MRTWPALLALALVLALGGVALALTGGSPAAAPAEVAAPATGAPRPEPIGSELAGAPDPPLGAAGEVEQETPEPTEPTEPSCSPAPLTERAAAVLVVGLPWVTDPDDPLAHQLPELGVGGVLITKTNVASDGQVAALLGALRERSRGPLVVATDEEFGRVSSFGVLLGRGSSPRTLAARRPPEEIRAAAAAMGAALRGYGVDLVLAPVADLDDGPARGVIGDRSFSADPATATEYVRAHADGLVDGGVLPSVKHFPGHGRSRVDSHTDGDVVDTPLDELRATDLVPFVDQIERGTPVVMLGHVAYTALGDDLPASMSPGAYALLRELGFEGVAMTDSLGMGAIHRRWDFPDAAVRAVTAGADAVLATDGNQAERMRDAIVTAVEAGDLPEERLDEAVARMRRLAGGDPAELVCVDVDFPTPPGEDAPEDEEHDGGPTG